MGKDPNKKDVSREVQGYEVNEDGSVTELGDISSLKHPQTPGKTPAPAEEASPAPEPAARAARTVTYDKDADADEERSTGGIVIGLIMFFGSFAVAMVWDRWFWYIMLAGAYVTLKSLKNWVAAIITFCVLLAVLLYTADMYLGLF